jgi:hypothetical protein
MKKVYMLTLLLGVILNSGAQISTSGLKDVTKKVTNAASASGFDVNALKSQIMSQLTPKLALNADQKTNVLNLVTNFLDQKAGIISLAKTNNNKYIAELAKLTEKLNAGLKTALTAQQFSKFLALKPKTNDPANILSQLFY